MRRDDHKYFGRGITKLRLRRGWTQEFLANKAGLTQGTVSRVEHGVDVTLSVACQLAGPFGYSVSYVCTEGRNWSPR